MAQYFIRLDDFCPTSNLDKWTRFFTLFDQYQIKPIIAVIPKNKDAKLMGKMKANPDYWQSVRDLQKKDYVIGMHGFEHRYQTGNSGTLKANRRSEFAGLSYSHQKEKITAAAQILLAEKVNPVVFIAPAHTFDYHTLLAIKNCTKIEIISDGLLDYPYAKDGFNWIPVQLSEPVLKRKGTWTFNFHPETCNDELFQRLTSFIAKNHKDFIGLNTLRYRPFTFRSYLNETYLINHRLLKDFTKKMIYR